MEMGNIKGRVLMGSYRSESRELVANNREVVEQNVRKTTNNPIYKDSEHLQ